MPVTQESEGRLLRIVALLEMKLKREPNFRTGLEGQAPEANWSRFSRIACAGIGDTVCEKGGEVLLTLPPMKQIVRDGVVKFDVNTQPLKGKRLKDSRGKRLIEAAIRVRNNVFHGGKDDPDLERYVGHDQAVVDAAIEVFEAAGVALVRYAKTQKGA